MDLSREAGGKSMWPERARGGVVSPAVGGSELLVDADENPRATPAFSPRLASSTVHRRALRRWRDSRVDTAARRTFFWAERMRRASSKPEQVAATTPPPQSVQWPQRWRPG